MPGPRAPVPAYDRVAPDTLLLRLSCGYIMKEHEKWERRFVVRLNDSVQKQAQRKFEGPGDEVRLAGFSRKSEL